jgi:hypothetical protein
MCYLGIDFDARIPKRCSDFVKMFGESGYLYIHPKIIRKPHFECVRRSRTHSKCELLLNFRIGTYHRETAGKKTGGRVVFRQ